MSTSIVIACAVERHAPSAAISPTPYLVRIPQAVERIGRISSSASKRIAVELQTDTERAERLSR